MKLKQQLALAEQMGIWWGKWHRAVPSQVGIVRPLTSSPNYGC